jgi:uncharacterized protein
MQDQRQARKIGEPHASFAGTYYRRLGILLLLGMIHAYAVWFGDILVAYAICGVFLYPMRTVRPSRLIAIGLIVFCVAILINTGLGAMITYLQRAGEEARTLLDAGQSITDEQKRILEAWDHTRPNVIPGEGKILAEVAARRGTWLESFNTNAELTMFFQTMLFLIWTLWRALGCMLIGMGLAKLGFFAARCTPRTYATLAFVGYLVGLPLIGFGATRVIANHADAGYAFGVGAQYNYVGSLFVALAHASLVMLICQLGLFKGAMFALAAVGRMAFTNYLMQSIICTFIFFGFGLGFFGKFERGEAYLFVLGVWALQLLWSPLWLEHCRFGPFEWAWRSLTYMNLQPLRRERPRPAA